MQQFRNYLPGVIEIGIPFACILFAIVLYAAQVRFWRLTAPVLIVGGLVAGRLIFVSLTRAPSYLVW